MASPSRKPPAQPPHPFKEEFAVILFVAALAILAIAAFFFGIPTIGTVLAIWFSLLALSTLVNVSSIIAYDIGYKGKDSHRRALLGLAIFVVTMALAYLAYDAERILNGLSMLWPR